MQVTRTSGPGGDVSHRPLLAGQGIGRTRAAWLDRASDALVGLLFALQGKYLSAAERADGWELFERLLDRYVAALHPEAV